MTGPTGVGKSAFAIALAEHIGGEIIGADAFQIFCGLPILTAQPPSDLLRRIPHHLIGVLSLWESCDAARYVRLATDAVHAVQSRGHRPILAGGTGLYLKAFTHGLANLPPVNPELRTKILGMEVTEALALLHETDSGAMELIDSKNPVRVRRALEIVLATGRPLQEARRTWTSTPLAHCGILLERDRDELRHRIAENVDAMFDEGVIEEVRNVGEAGPGASRAIGYREIRDLLSGKISHHECRQSILTATRRYAKRQLTWCRHQFSFPSINLTPPPSLSDPLEAALRLLDASDA